MRKRGSKRQTIEHLSYASFLDTALLVFAPVACRKSTSQAFCDCIVLDQGVESEAFLTFIDLSGKQFLHIFHALSELLTE